MSLWDANEIRDSDEIITLCFTVFKEIFCFFLWNRTQKRGHMCIKPFVVSNNTSVRFIQECALFPRVVLWPRWVWPVLCVMNLKNKTHWKPTDLHSSLWKQLTWAAAASDNTVLKNCPDFVMEVNEWRVSKPARQKNSKATLAIHATLPTLWFSSLPQRLTISFLFCFFLLYFFIAIQYRHSVGVISRP